MLLVDLGSANHLKKSATSATPKCINALFMPYFEQDIDLIARGICGDIVSFGRHQT